MNLPWKSINDKYNINKKNYNKTKLENYFTLEDNRECIAMFFKFVNEEVKKSEKKGTILFTIENDINWIIILGKGAEFISNKLIEQYNPDCIVITDSYSMTKLARGVLKPMSAILGGQLKIDGDTNTFGELTPVLKSSVKLMMEHNKTNFNLDVSILRTYEKTDENGNRHTEYVIRSIDRIGGNYWETPHRFSDFDSFRKLLRDSGYNNLPDLPRKHIIQSSVNPRVVRRRMEDLALFLQLVIIQIGSSDPNVINFLGAYISGNNQTINHISTINQSSSNIDTSSTGDNSDHNNNNNNSTLHDDIEDDGNDNYHIDESIKMKHALKVAQEHIEHYAHETHRRPSVTTSSYYSHSTSISFDGESKTGSFNNNNNNNSSNNNNSNNNNNNSNDSNGTSVTLGTGSISNQNSTITPSKYKIPSLSLSTTSKLSRTGIVQTEIFQLKKRIEELESNSTEGKSFSSQIASWCLYLLPRVTLWGTIFCLVLGVAIPYLISSEDKILELSFSNYHILSSILSFFTFIFSLILLVFLSSMSISRLPAGISLLIYVLYPLLSPLLLIFTQLIQHEIYGYQSFFQCSNNNDYDHDNNMINQCGFGVYLVNERKCSYSPTNILFTSLSYIIYQIITRKGFLPILFSWLISIPINYSLTAMKNYGINIFPPNIITKLLKYLMIIERLFTIYTPIATVISAYIYLYFFLNIFGYTTPSLISGSTNDNNSNNNNNSIKEKNMIQQNNRRLHENKNLYSSAYSALDRVLAEYVLNEICTLQSIFIKIGQYVAGRPDLVSQLWSTTLSKLHDNCPTSSPLYVKSMIETCLTATKNKDDKLYNRHKIYQRQKKIRLIDELFETFDMKPIASGSIAQIHQATMIIDGQLCDVIVKVQHPTTETLIYIDLKALITIITIATKFYSKWEPLLQVVKEWEKTLTEELDFRIEAKNMIEVSQHMGKAGFGTSVPEPIRGYIHRKVLVMTKLNGFKLTDNFSLSLHCIDKASLLCRVAHSLAYQMLVAGFFNADPHPGNILCIQELNNNETKQKKPGNIANINHFLDTPSTLDDNWRPGFVDFGMTHRLKDETRLLYCHLLISLQEEDLEGVTKVLKSLNYVTNQTNRNPERDQEFFEFLFRDANDIKTAHLERKLFNDVRNAQRAEDSTCKEYKDTYQRQIIHTPIEYFYITRTVGLLRGLSAIMNVRCPIIEIFTLQARIGIHQRNDSNNINEITINNNNTPTTNTNSNTTSTIETH